jgi:hypothetical protein
MMTLKQRSLIGLAALCAIASTQACGSDDTGTPTTQAGSPGVAGAAHAGSAGSGVSGGGAASAGAPAAGAPAGGAASGSGGAAAGAPAGGAGSGSGGAAAGSGGSSAGSGGKGGGKGGSGGASGGSSGASSGSGGGSSTATFAAVKTIFSASCGTGQCHNAGSMHTNFQTGDLYAALTTAIPATPANNECNGSTLVTPNDAAGSILVKVISGTTAMCKDAGTDKPVPKMPYMCGTNPMCLSADKIKTISDWIAAGAPQ